MGPLASHWLAKVSFSKFTVFFSHECCGKSWNGRSSISLRSGEEFCFFVFWAWLFRIGAWFISSVLLALCNFIWQGSWGDLCGPSLVGVGMALAVLWPWDRKLDLDPFATHQLQITYTKSGRLKVMGWMSSVWLILRNQNSLSLLEEPEGGREDAPLQGGQMSLLPGQGPAALVHGCCCGLSSACLHLCKPVDWNLCWSCFWKLAHPSSPVSISWPAWVLFTANPRYSKCSSRAQLHVSGSKVIQKPGWSLYLLCVPAKLCRVLLPQEQNLQLLNILFAHHKVNVSGSFICFKMFLKKALCPPATCLWVPSVKGSFAIFNSSK